MFPTLQNSLRGVGFETITDIKTALASQGKIASGRLRNSVRFEIVDTSAVLSLVMKAEKQWKFVDEGRKAGKKAEKQWKFVDEGRKARKQPPTSAIARWIRQKGINANPFVIARAIGRNGIPPTGIFTDAIEKTKRNLGLRIGRLARKDVENLTLKSLKTK